MRSPLNSLITAKSLAITTGSQSSLLIDHLVEEGDLPLATINVCAKLAKQLSDEIDDICTVLSISKRAFVEAALIEGVGIARSIMEQERVLETLTGRD